MTGVKLSDLVVPAVWTPYILEQSTYLNKFINSGIAQPVPALGAIAEKGTTVNVPFFVANLSGDWEALLEDVSLTPGKLTANNQVGVVVHRGRGWTTNDLAGLATGADPMMALGDKVADYLANQEQKDLLACLQGVFGGLTSNSGAAFAGLSYIPGSSTNLTPGVVNAMRQKLGDQGRKLRALAIHSSVWYDLSDRNLIQYTKTGDVPSVPASSFTGTAYTPNGDADPGKFLNLDLIVDDDIPTDGTNYAVYGFVQGAVGTAEQNTITTETDRDIFRSGGEDAMVIRKHFVYHPLGASWSGVAAPTRAQLATASNWSLVYNPKNIGVVRGTVTSNYTVSANFS